MKSNLFMITILLFVIISANSAYGAEENKNNKDNDKVFNKI